MSYRERERERITHINYYSLPSILFPPSNFSFHFYSYSVLLSLILIILTDNIVVGVTADIHGNGDLIRRLGGELKHVVM